MSTSPTGTAVEFAAVTVHRTGRDLVRDVSFRVPAGTVHAVLGHNGAGKTTLMRALADQIPVRRGSITAAGTATVLFASSAMPPELTVADILEHRRRCEGATGDAVAVAVTTCAIGGFLDRRFGRLSTGMAQRVAIACALIADSPIIVLDEPTTGLDPQGVDALMQVLSTLRAGGRTVMICSHDLARLEYVCNGVTCLRDGRVTADGPVAQVAGGVEVPGHLLRTGDDQLACRLLRDAGLTATGTERGVHVAASAPLPAVVRTLAGQVELIESTVDTSLFERIYRRYAAAPDDRSGRRRRR